MNCKEKGENHEAHHILNAGVFVLGAVSQPSAAMTQRELNEQATDMYNTVMIERFEEEGYPDSYGGAWLNTEIESK